MPDILLFRNFRLAKRTLLFACSVILIARTIAVAADFIQLNDDAGWCWFEDERVLIVGDQLVAGSVAMGTRDPARKGDIEVMSYDLKGGNIIRHTLHQQLQADDHNSPALLRRTDGRYLAMYSKHGPENRIYYRVTVRPGDVSEWREEHVFVPSESSRVTYSNLHWLSDDNRGRGRLYNFFRGFDNTYKPSWMYSDDEGETWTAGGLLVDFPVTVRHRPYVKYASDGKATIHFAFTEGHPANYDNSIYHVYFRAGQLHRSDGTVIRALRDGPVVPAEATRIFTGDPNNVGWIHDLALDDLGRPRLVYSVQKDSAGLGRGQGGHDLRYRFARWDGKAWQDGEIAYAGERLYAGEDDYAGGICVHPDDPQTIFISTNVDPDTGEKLTSGHYEIFRGTMPTGAVKCTWTPVTKNSALDNLRPIVPKWKRGKTALLWLRGKYSSYTNYDQVAVLKLFE
jgi:hypothetical protein